VQTLKKSLLFFCCLFLASLSMPGFVFADNDDPNLPACTIIVNGVPALLGGGGEPPQALAHHESRRDGSGAIMAWPISVQMNGAENLICPGSTVRVAVQQNALSPWSESILTQDGGTFGGIIELGAVLTSPTSAARSIDVEIAQPGPGCASGDPICQRVYLRFNGQAIENPDNEEGSCSPTEAAMESAFSSVKTQYIVGENFNVSLAGTLAPYLDACGLFVGDYNLIRNGSTVSSGQLGESISVPITLVGNYQLEVKFFRENCTGVGCGRGAVAKTINKSFCVTLNAGEPCNAPQTSEDIADAPPSPFNLCRQIPIITDEQIEGIVAETDDRAKQYQNRTELEARQERLIREKRQCCECSGGVFNGSTFECTANDSSGDGQGIYTAVGCIPSTSEGIVAQMVRIGLGIAGGVGLLMILVGGFMLTTSQGEPKRAGEAKELITSAVMGLLFIIFSVTILQFIGVSILRLPGFGGQ
jgi:hypothetical protein